MKRQFLMISLVCICSLSTGCVHRFRDSISYLHPDFNTLNQPALHIDKYSHSPPKARHVDHYRWMYNKGPIDHTLVPELYSHQPITNQTLVPVGYNGSPVGVSERQSDPTNNLAQPKAYVTADWMFSETARR